MAERKYFTLAEVADQLRIAPKTLRVWIRKGRGPLPVGEGRAVRFSQASLDQWEREEQERKRAEATIQRARSRKVRRIADELADEVRQRSAGAPRLLDGSTASS